MSIKIKSIPGLESAAREMGMTAEEAAEHFIRTEMPLRTRKFFARSSPRQGLGGGDVAMFKRKQKQ